MKRFACIAGCGLCCTVSPITVFPHEVLILRFLAEKLDVEVRFRPGYLITDVANGVKIALSYLLLLNEGGSCPFFNPKTKRCVVHNLYKPLTCRSFPYLPKVIRYIVDPVTRTVDFTAEFVVSSLCPVVRESYDRREVEAMASNPRIAIKVMRGEVEAALEALEARRVYAEALTALWRAGFVELRSGDDGGSYPIVNAYEFIRKLMPNIALNLQLTNIFESLKKAVTDA